VVRRSTFNDTNTLRQVTELDAHGMCNGLERGTRSWEAYDNVFNAAGNSRTLYLRGGDGVVFNNAFNYQTIGTPVELIDYRASSGDESIAGQCGYNAEYPRLGPNDYPAPDQIRDAYFWNNKRNGSPTNPTIAGYPYNSNFIQLNRDYFLTPKPGYKPYAYPHPVVQATDAVFSPPPSTHPADVNADSKMELNEATSYGFCWKSAPAVPAGCPANATLDYAVRAGTLWSSSADGTYQFDSTKNPPLCWLP
jgi:hypothetical protein